jgi:hypothetical protein
MDALDTSKIGGTLSQRSTWLVLVIAAGCGLLGGLAHRFGSPPEDPTSLASYVVVGAASALAALLVINPSDGVRLVALSILAGYGGKAFLEATEARAKVLIATSETARAKDEAKQAVQIGREAIGTANKLAQQAAALERSLMEKSNAKKREDIIGPLQGALPQDLAPFVSKPPASYQAELNVLGKKLDDIERLLSPK